MAEAHYYYDEFINNVNNQVTVVSVDTVTGLLQNQLSFSGGNNWSNDYDSDAQERISKTANQVGALAGAVTGIDIPNIRIKFFNQTTKSWTGPQIPSFNVEMLLVAVRPNQDTTKMAKSLMAGVMPVDKGGLIAAPLNYGPRLGGVTGGAKLGLNQAGTVGVKIGRWFQAFGLVMNSVNPSFSQQVGSNGKPIWTKVSINFEPYRAISYGEFTAWFTA